MSGTVSTRRSARRATRAYLALIIGTVFLGAACEKASPVQADPVPSPTASLPSNEAGQPATALEIGGNRSIAELGATTQLTAVVRYADGTAQDVTAQAQWRALDEGLNVISPGLLRAWSYGEHVVQVVYRNGDGAVSANAGLRVGPEDAFLLRVYVGTYSLATPGARVLVNSPAGTFSGVTDQRGFVLLPAVGDTTVEVEMDGFGSITKSVTVTGDQDIAFVQ